MGRHRQQQVAACPDSSIRPATNETIKSYLHRLATVHDVIYEEMWTWVSIPNDTGAEARTIVGQRHRSGNRGAGSARSIS